MGVLKDSVPVDSGGLGARALSLNTLIFASDSLVMVVFVVGLGLVDSVDQLPPLRGSSMESVAGYKSEQLELGSVTGQL